MLAWSLITLLLSNALTLRRDKSILYSRGTIMIVLFSTLISYGNLNYLFLDKGIGIFGGLFHSTSTTTVFHNFILIIGSVILLLTSFFPRKVWLKEYSSMDKLLFTKLEYSHDILVNKTGKQFKIIEYSLMTLFIVLGGIFLMSTSDLVSIFLSIELQSYGLYLLSTIYRDSEPATSSGLMYFLLGGLSSCFILLSTSLLYANSGTTSLDSLYIISSISTISEENMSSLLYWYKSYYIHISLLFMSVGFLFKVSAAPFHFWSPDVYDGIPTVVTTFVAIIAKISIFIFLLELVHYTNKSLLDLNFSWTMSLLYSSLLSLVIGTIVGLTQSRIKRLYAFSTISHVGFILLGLTIHTVESTQAFLFYIMQYSVSNLNAFIIIIAIGYSLYCYVDDKKSLEDSSKKEDKEIIYENKQEIEEEKQEIEKEKQEIEEEKPEIYEYIQQNFSKNIVDNLQENREYEDLSKNIVDNLQENREYEDLSKNIVDNLQDVNNSPIQLIDQLKGYYYINPLLSLSLAITLFSFAGIPPLLGFFGKQMILSAAIDAGYLFMSLVAIITSVISAVYYLSIIKEMFFNKPNYTLNDELISLEADALITEKNTIINKTNIKIQNIVLSSSLSLSIGIITFIILLFIMLPEELLSLTNILALLLFNI